MTHGNASIGRGAEVKARRTARIGLMALPAIIWGGARLLRHGNRRERRAAAPDRGTINVRKAAVGTSGLGALATGAIAIGALAIGALAIGRLVIHRLVIANTRLDSLEIGELKVEQLRVSKLAVTDALTTPTGKASPKTKRRSAKSNVS